MKKFALIVAGGSGTRMNSEVPKQFLELAGRPVLMHTMEVFYRYDEEINDHSCSTGKTGWIYGMHCVKNIISVLNINWHLEANTRFQSVQNGLQQISDDGIVFIHDGVRPIVSLTNHSKLL